MFLLPLLGCTSTPPAPPSLSSDSETTRAAIDAVCKLVEGADQPCERLADGVRFGGTKIGVQGRILPLEQTLGNATLRGLVHLEGPERTLVTRLRGFGGGKSEALTRGIHEWALVSGTAAVDTWLGESRALRAVEPEAVQPASPLAGHDVHRGWTLFRPKGVIEHPELLKALAPAFADRSPAGVLTLEVTRQAGEAHVECWMQGEPDEAMCTRARAFAWPTGEYELRTAYAVVQRQEE